MRKRSKCFKIALLFIIAALLQSIAPAGCVAMAETDKYPYDDINDFNWYDDYADWFDDGDNFGPLTAEEVALHEASTPMENTSVGAMLVNLTDRKLLTSNLAFVRTDVNRLNGWMVLLYALRNCDLNQVAIVSDTDVQNAKKEPFSSSFGFVAGDIISIRDLLVVYMMTQSDDARLTIIRNSVGNEAKMVSKMNQVAAKLGMQDTYYTTTNHGYHAEQYTTPFDLYLLFNELLEHPLFVETYQKNKAAVSYQAVDGSTKTKNVTNTEKNISLLYGEFTVPDGLTAQSRMSGGVEQSGLAQVVFAGDDFGTEYLSIVTRVPFEKEVSIESERLLSAAFGEPYFDQAQTLPLGDDTVRYRYLLGSEVKYYTIYDKPAGYANVGEANQYMMTITVPVWNLDAKGTSVKSTMKLTVNRKLVTSVRKIFNEIFALDIRFPVKQLKGYGYRQSGGVGLSNCTLISVHSYGAAIDINPGNYDNDYYLGAGNDLRDTTNPYYIPKEVIEIFENNGWYWGGYFNICVDSMHFQYLGLDYLSYQDNSPFRTVTTSSATMTGIDVENLQKRLTELGYQVIINGVYSANTATAVRKFQRKQGLQVTGECDYKTWETVINLTHYMSYVF